MNTLVVQVMSHEESWEKNKIAMSAALAGEAIDVPFSISFQDIESLTKTMLAPNRLNIINTMAGAGSMSIRELSRRLNRDFRAVHRDITILLKSGVIDHDEDDKIIFPFTDVHFDFNLEGKVA